MSGFADQCVQVYPIFYNETHRCLRGVKTPFIEVNPEEEVGNTGHLQPIASSVLMKTLYIARVARYDLLKPVTYLASG